jgi:hypothetical protein
VTFCACRSATFLTRTKERKITRRNSCQVVAERWLAGLVRRVRVNSGAERIYRKAKLLLERFIFWGLGDWPIGGTTATEPPIVLRQLEIHGLHESA